MAKMRLSFSYEDIAVFLRCPLYWKRYHKEDKSRLHPVVEASYWMWMKMFRDGKMPPVKQVARVCADAVRANVDDKLGISLRTVNNYVIIVEKIYQIAETLISDDFRIAAVHFPATSFFGKAIFSEEVPVLLQRGSSIYPFYVFPVEYSTQKVDTVFLEFLIAVLRKENDRIGVRFDEAFYVKTTPMLGSAEVNVFTAKEERIKLAEERLASFAAMIELAPDLPNLKSCYQCQYNKECSK